jgi:hypothetical protein
MSELGVGQIAQDRTHRLFQRNGEHALTRRGERWITIEHVSEETVNGGEAGIPRPDRVPAGGLEGGEELQQAIRREVFDVQRRRRTGRRVGDKTQQQLECVAIRRDGVWAGIALGW